MTKTEAHEILNRIREGQSMPLSLTNQALERTGDLCRAPGESLCAIGYEPSDYRPRQAHDTLAEVGFSYSAYLDFPKTEGVTQ